MNANFLTKCSSELAELRAAITAAYNVRTEVDSAPPPRGPVSIEATPTCHELKFTRNGYDHVIQYRLAVKNGELTGRRYMRVNGHLCNSVRGVLQYLNSLA